MTTFADDQPAVIRAVGQQVDEPLQATEARLAGILILVRPRLVLGHVGAVRELHIDRVERDEEVFSAVDLFKGVDDAGFAAEVIAVAQQVGTQRKRKWTFRAVCCRRRDMVVRSKGE